MAVNDDIPTDIRRQNEIQSIPIYSGNVDDQPFNVWLRDAEATALVNDWPRDATKKYLASRLKGTAIRWHVERLQTHPTVTYRELKNA